MSFFGFSLIPNDNETKHLIRRRFHYVHTLNTLGLYVAILESLVSLCYFYFGPTFRQHNPTLKRLKATPTTDPTHVTANVCTESLLPVLASDR